MMKINRTYLKPAIQVVEVKSDSVLLAASPAKAKLGGYQYEEGWED